MRGFSQGRHVLHLECLRAGRLGEYHLGLVGDQLGNTGTDDRIVIRRFYTEPPQYVVAEPARRTIDGIGYEDLVAGFDERKKGCRDRRQPRRRDQRRIAALELGDHGLERLHRRRAKPAVAVVL